MKNSFKTVAFAGGGTGGPTTPLLAIASVLKQDYPDIKLIFIGTAEGPEKIWAGELGLEFETLPVAKFRRYFSLQNLFDVFKLVYSFFRALSLILQNKIDVVVGAGGFISVPVIWAAKILGRKVLIHQQDVEPTLSNKLTHKFADLVTLTFPEQKKDFTNGVVTGNPVRPTIFTGNRERALHELVLSPDKKTIFVFGGGSGALELDRIVLSAAQILTGNGHQILHIVGKNSPKEGEFLSHIGRGYVSRTTLTGEQMAGAYAVADVVVCRAGLATLAELSALGKAAIVIPMPDSHQEQNAEILKQKSAAKVFSQKDLNPEKLINAVEEILQNESSKLELQKNISSLMPHDASNKIAEHVYKLANLP